MVVKGGGGSEFMGGRANLLAAGLNGEVVGIVSKWYG